MWNSCHTVFVGTGNIVAVAGVTEAFDSKQEGENYTRTLMRFENGQTATLEMGGCDKLNFLDCFRVDSVLRLCLLATEYLAHVTDLSRGNIAY